jgi:hypothetical protein
MFMDARPVAGFVTEGVEKRPFKVVETKLGADKALALKLKTKLASPILKAVDPKTLILTTNWVGVTDTIL